MRTTSYLSSAAVRKLSGKQRRRVISGGVLTAFFGLATAMSIMNYSPEIRQGLPVYVGLLIPSVLLLVLGLRAKQDLELARRYDLVFCGDQDGVVTEEELTRSMGRPIAQLSQELERLFREGLFEDCSLTQGSGLSVVLSRSRADGPSFITVQCSHCGASVRLRAGTSGKCEYCGGDVSG